MLGGPPQSKQPFKTTLYANGLLRRIFMLYDVFKLGFYFAFSSYVFILPLSHMFT